MRSFSVNRRRGIALIITVVLLAFLLILVLGLVSIVRVENSIAGNVQNQAVARQNALMALNLAIGELQVATGPDQRVTAPAEATPSQTVLTGSVPPSAPAASSYGNSWRTWENDLETYWGTRSPHWVGAWRNSSAHPTETPRLVNWLVSGNERLAQTSGSAHASVRFRPDMTVAGLAATSTASALTPNINGTPAVVLVGNYSVSAQSNPASPSAGDLKNYVVAPKVDIAGRLASGASGIIGRYAWWVGDQGVKATLDAAGSDLTGVINSNNTLISSQGQEQALALQMPRQAGFQSVISTIKSVDNNDAAIWNRLLSYEQFVFGPSTTSTGLDPAVLRPRFHDFGISSEGLLIDITNGGFRRDLTNAPASTPVGTNLAAYQAVASAPNILSGNLKLGSAAPNPNSDPDQNADVVRTHPLNGIGIGAVLKPVVASVKIRFRIRLEGSNLVLEASPQLLLWNPYNTDFEWLETVGTNTYRNGYRYRVRLAYDRDDPTNSGNTWNGQASVGILWFESGGSSYVSQHIGPMPLTLFTEDNSTGGSGSDSLGILGREKNLVFY